VFADPQQLTEYMAKAHEEKLRAVKQAEEKKNAEIEVRPKPIPNGDLAGGSSKYERVLVLARRSGLDEPCPSSANHLPELYYGIIPLTWPMLIFLYFYFVFLCFTETQK
jgi:hypothetical protein